MANIKTGRTRKEEETVQEMRKLLSRKPRYRVKLIENLVVDIKLFFDINPEPKENTNSQPEKAYKVLYLRLKAKLTAKESLAECIKNDRNSYKPKRRKKK